MPETACLHIQARDTDPIRVVELPGVSVRIGRASYCEVRLAEPDLAEEECRLRRRGGTWHLVPMRPPGSVWLDGHSVEQPCPLPYDIPFRVGEHWLTLRSSSTAAPEWGAYHLPIPVELPPAIPLAPEEFRTESRHPRTPEEDGSRKALRADRPPLGDDLERLARWQARQEQRESWLKARQEDRRWQERWKAAGERLRGRSESPASPPGPRPPPRRRCPGRVSHGPWRARAVPSLESERASGFGKSPDAPQCPRPLPVSILRRTPRRPRSISFAPRGGWCPPEPGPFPASRCVLSRRTVSDRSGEPSGRRRDRPWHGVGGSDLFGRCAVRFRVVPGGRR